MWELSNNRQALAALVAFGLGVAYAAGYCVLRALRIAVRHSKAAVNIEDIIFFEIISFVTFIFALALLSGEIRFFMLLFILLGFLGFHFTLSAALAKFLGVIFKYAFAFFAKINRYIKAAVDFLLNTMQKILHIMCKNLLKSLKYIKKHLKAVGSLVYTKDIKK